MRIHPSHPRLRLLALLTPFALMAFGLPACKTPSRGEQGGATSVVADDGDMDCLGTADGGDSLAPDGGVDPCPGDGPQITVGACSFLFSGLEDDPVTSGRKVQQGQKVRLFNEQGVSVDVTSKKADAGTLADLFQPLDAGDRRSSKVCIPSGGRGRCVRINPDIGAGRYTLESKKKKECESHHEGMTGTLEVVPKTGQEEP